MIHFLAWQGLKNDIFELYHFRLFPFIRFAYDFTFGQLPFPFVYILILVLIFTIVRGVMLFKRNLVQEGVRFAALFAVQKLIHFTGIIVFIFYFGWAFNYYRPSLSEQLKLPEIEIDSAMLVNELQELSKMIKLERSLLTDAKSEYNPEIEMLEMENKMRTSQKQILQSWGSNTPGYVRVRALYPKGCLLRFATAGIYLPFAFEGHIDPGLNKIIWPFTLAHEMAHGYGYTDEGECNFIGFITCVNSKDPFYRYSGLLSYWRYLFYEVNHRYPAIATQIYSEIGQGIRSDLKAIRRENEKYPDILPKLRDFIYDTYLKNHGVTKGLRSYNELLILVQKYSKAGYELNISR
ncbi:MAG: DUF3810 domain-containing protein [Saprospiraceae bacterium]|nr:DUF3810 domain-containing protein [Saprospiraceae bacterium]MBK8669863.1 DUF3810 domain-containing protein [Saprospiraceae bacterium]